MNKDALQIVLMLIGVPLGALAGLLIAKVLF